MKSYSDEPEASNDVSVQWLIKSLVRGIVDGLRRNKIAAALATLTLVVSTLLAFNYRLDGYNDYQQFILPRLLRLEYGFRRSFQAAENTTGDWRAYYFENSHRQVRDILRAARLDHPKGVIARGKHRKFIQYYERLDSEFSRIGLLARANPGLDYILETKKAMDELKPMRDVWAQWADPKENGS